MSVETFNPAQPRIGMTDAARQQAHKEIVREHARGIRLAVKESGCSGYMYVLDYVHEAQDGDTQVPFGDDVILFVDRESLP
ncbi:MAG: HesB/IscA family protein, partial [Alcanivoracaceae bacterium]